MYGSSKIDFVIGQSKRHEKQINKSIYVFIVDKRERKKNQQIHFYIYYYYFILFFFVSHYSILFSRSICMQCIFFALILANCIGVDENKTIARMTIAIIQIIDRFSIIGILKKSIIQISNT